MSTKRIRNYINADVNYSMTPDTPLLRYYGSGIPVFLWDDLQDYQQLQLVLGSLDVSSCYESKYFSAFTCSDFVPWYNMDTSQNSYAAYCLEEYDDLAFLDVPEYTHSIPMKMKGKVCLVSLEALQELDCYYENDHIFTRTLIDVYPTQWSKTPTKVYTWLNSVDQISSFDHKTSEYVLDEDIDLTPFTEKETNKIKHYEM